MVKTRQIFCLLLFTLAFFSARGQFSAKDRLLSGGFNMNYTNEVGKVSSQTAREFDIGIKPQMSIFLSSHFSMGWGLDMVFSHQKRVYNNANNDISLSNRIKAAPRLTAQYYRPFAEKWYAAIRFDCKPIDLELYQSSLTNSAGLSFNSKYKFDSNIGLITSLTPLVGYRASKHWLIEGQLGVLSLTANRNKTDSGNYSFIYVSGQFRPTLFNFSGIYVWSKKAPSVLKDKQF